jgi:PiT family inorganic phosphate transporter
LEAQLIYIGLAALFGVFMAWGIGANDVANAMATSVGSKALTIRQAILVAAVFEFLGAVLAGGEVTSTIRKGIVDVELLAGTPELLIYGMLASLLSAGTWLLIASRLAGRCRPRIPSSAPSWVSQPWVLVSTPSSGMRSVKS